jgi:CheY-like chemotaxis protein
MRIDNFDSFPLYDLESLVPRVALVVDDSMLIRHTVCRFLQERGYVAEAASNGLEALEILKTVLPDVIITDLLMPKMDGDELIGRLRASAKTASIPIVVLKGKDSSGDQSSHRLADAAIFKDIDIVKNLDEALKMALDSPKAPVTERAS